MTEPGFNDHSSSAPTVIFPMRKTRPPVLPLGRLRIRHHSWRDQHTLGSTAVAPAPAQPRDAAPRMPQVQRAIVAVDGSDLGALQVSRRVTF